MCQGGQVTSIGTGARALRAGFMFRRIYVSGDEEPTAVNWINNVVRPKISGLLSTTKRDVPDNLWVKCPETGQMVFYKDLEANQFVVPGSNYHMRMSAVQRLNHVFDGGDRKSVV